MTPDEFAHGLRQYKAQRNSDAVAIVGAMILLLFLLVGVVRIGLGVENWVHGDGFVTTHDVSQERNVTYMVGPRAHVGVGEITASPVPEVPQ